MKKPVLKSSTRRTSGKKNHRRIAPVDVCLDRHSICSQADDFRLCPLGMQMQSQKPLAQFQMLEFTLNVCDNGQGHRDISCCGVVVNCQPEKQAGSYRIWIKFLDLAKDDAEYIRSYSKKTEHTCPYCANS